MTPGLGDIVLIFLYVFRRNGVKLSSDFTADLATLARNTATTAIAPNHPFTITTRPTPTQQKAFDLLGVTCSQ